jgi:hypothetical protein
MLARPLLVSVVSRRRFRRTLYLAIVEKNSDAANSQLSGSRRPLTRSIFVRVKMPNGGGSQRGLVHMLRSITFLLRRHVRWRSSREYR